MLQNSNKETIKINIIYIHFHLETPYIKVNYRAKSIFSLFYYCLY